MSEASEILKELGLDINDLIDIAIAKKEGRFVILPCKVGDTVFAIFKRKIHRCQVGSIHLSDFPTWKDGRHYARLYSYEDCRKRDVLWLSMAFNKTVFLTREAAEKALQALEQIEKAGGGEK